MNKKLFQGDVSYVKITQAQLDKLLNGKKFEGQKLNGSFVVVHGETGNSHKIVTDRPTENLVEIMEVGNGLFALKVKGQAVITHEKHIPAKVLDKGFYFISRKTEYDVIFERLVRD